MTHVFISYSRADQMYVKQLASHLGALGFVIWYDYEIDVHHGDYRTPMAIVTQLACRNAAHASPVAVYCCAVEKRRG